VQLATTAIPLFLKSNVLHVNSQVPVGKLLESASFQNVQPPQDIKWVQSAVTLHMASMHTAASTASSWPIYIDPSIYLCDEQGVRLFFGMPYMPWIR